MASTPPSEPPRPPQPGDPFGAPPATDAFGRPVGPGYMSAMHEPVGKDKATTALVCAILGIFCFPPLGIVAFVQGRQASGEANRTGRPLDGTLKVAYIIGIVETVLVALAVLIFVFALIVGAAGSTT